MSTADDIFSSAMKLPESDRAALARQLLLSLEPDAFDPDCEAAWQAEIERRLASVERGSYQASEWREALARVRKSLGREDSGARKAFAPATQSSRL